MLAQAWLIRWIVVAVVAVAAPLLSCSTTWIDLLTALWFSQRDQQRLTDNVSHPVRTTKTPVLSPSPEKQEATDMPQRDRQSAQPLPLH